MKGLKKVLGLSTGLALALGMSMNVSASTTLSTYVDSSGNEVAAGTGEATQYDTNQLTGDDEALGSWSGVTGLAYRTALYVVSGSIDATNSVQAALQTSGGAASDTGIANFVVNASTPGFSAVIVKDSDYTISNATINLDTDADGAPDSNGKSTVNDFAGLGAAVAVYGNSDVTIEDSQITTTGVAKAATFADDGADLIVKNSTLRVNGGTIYSGYKSTANQSLMINPPWVLGISGSARTTNVMGENTTATYIDTDISAADWGAVSIDTGSNMLITTINCDVTVDGSGYGAYAIGDGTEEYFLGTDFDVETYAVILTGASVTFDSYTGGDIIGITKISDGSAVTDASSEEVATGQTVVSTVESDDFGFMFHANGSDNTNNLTLQGGTTVHTGNATFLIKKVNNNITVDNASITSDDGVILQMIDNDDDMVGAFMDDVFGMPTFNYSFNEEDGWSSTWGVEYADSGWVTNASFTDTEISGNLYNGTGYTSNGAQTLNVTLGSGATLNGAIAATAYQHESKSFTYYDESEGYNATTAAAAAAKLGHVKNLLYYNGENDVNVTLEDDAVWTVTGTSLVTSLTISENASVKGVAYVLESIDEDGTMTLGDEVTLKAGETYEETLVLKALSTTSTSDTTDDTTSGTTSGTTEVVTVSAQSTTDALTSAIEAAVAANPNGSTIDVTVKYGTSVSKSAMQAIMDAGDSLIVHSSTTAGVVQWTFSSITTAMDFNPAVTVGSTVSAVSSRMSDASDINYVSVSFEHDGTLPGTAEVYLNLGDGAKSFTVGSTVYLYYYNPTYDRFELTSSGTYDGTGATFTMTHCSDYVVTDTVLPTALLTASSPTTGETGPVAIYIFGLGIAVLAGSVAVRRKFF